jgi:cell division protein FtsB
MTTKQSVFLSIGVLVLVSLLFFIIFGEHGLIDLSSLKNERNQLIEKSEQLSRNNYSLSVEIDRLKHDPKYIENVARQELGMVGEGELILKPRSMPDQSE